MQTMEVADEDKFDFDPLDVTKVWPEHLFPLQPVGRMVLNKNPDNFFAENEQLAFCPSLVVPGARPAPQAWAPHEAHELGAVLFVSAGCVRADTRLGTNGL